MINGNHASISGDANYKEGDHSPDQATSSSLPPAPGAGPPLKSQWLDTVLLWQVPCNGPMGYLAQSLDGYLVVPGEDPTQVDPLTIKDIPVMQTIVGGETVYGG